MKVSFALLDLTCRNKRIILFCVENCKKQLETVIVMVEERELYITIKQITYILTVKYIFHFPKNWLSEV